jgi:hypothetical protein
MQPVRNFFDPVADNDEMPVVWHHLIRDHLHLVSVQRLSHHPDESLIVRDRFEQDRLSDGPVHHVKHSSL